MWLEIYDKKSYFHFFEPSFQLHFIRRKILLLQIQSSRNYNGWSLLNQISNLNHPLLTTQRVTINQVWLNTQQINKSQFIQQVTIKSKYWKQKIRTKKLKSTPRNVPQKLDTGNLEIDRPRTL